MHCSNEKIDVDSKTCNGSSGSASHSQFRKRFMEVLRRPYNAKEYEELWHEVSHRKPMERQRVLRGRTIAYPTKSVGESYLDQHCGKFIMTNSMFSYILNVLFMIDESHDLIVTKPTFKDNSKFTTMV